jgi:hypothetical protein
MAANNYGSFVKALASSDLGLVLDSSAFENVQKVLLAEVHNGGDGWQYRVNADDSLG